MKRHKDENKVVRLDEVWKARKKEGNLIAILEDSKRIARAIEARMCVTCNTVKMCVNKTGLCTACYQILGDREKKVADDEASHKKIEFKVSDDRWKTPDDR